MADRIITPARSGLAPVLTPTAAPRRITVEPPPSAGVRQRLRNSRLLIALIAIATLGVHMLANAITPYGPHRDELLYLAMGSHLRFWAMDFPPFIAVLAEATRIVLGDSLFAIRLPSAVAGTALVTLAFVLARAFGGSRTAAVWASLAMLANPLFLRAATLFQPVVLDQLWWTIGLAALVRIGNVRTPMVRRATAAARWSARPPDAKAWLVLGAACGLGLLTKFSIAFFGAGVVVAILATPLRRALRTPWPWIAFAIALVIGSPSLVGQIRLGWPVLGQMAELRASQLERIGPLDFVLGQLSLGPAVVLAALGLWYLFRSQRTRAWRAIGWTCATAFVLLLLLHGKAYYAAPIYPALIAAGAVWLDQRILRIPLHSRQRWARIGVVAVLAVFGLVTLPFGLPVLPPATMARYAARFGSSGTTTNTGGHLALPQDYADMLGWPEQAGTVARALEKLPAAQRAEVVLIARNYGEAGALDYYGPALGLPPVVSPAGSYWFFGPGDLPGATVVALGVPPADLQRFCRRVTPIAHVTHDQLVWMVDEERDVVVSLCENPVASLQELWPSLKPR